MANTQPTSTIKADLNGTGVLVDITSYVDQASGIRYSAGRTDWTQDAPAPGVITFNLDNQKDFPGQFTPGNVLPLTTGRWLVGCRDGVLVEWTCGTRVLRFRMQTPQLTFVTGAPQGSMVSVACSDALALLQTLKLDNFYSQTVLTANPLAYWKFNEAAPTDGSAAQSLDISGNIAPPLVPRGNPAAFGWQQGTAPKVTGDTAIQMYPSVVTPTANGDSSLSMQVPLAFQPTAGQYVGLIPFQPSIGLSGGTLMAYSMWCNINNIYGPMTFPGGNTGPYVHILTAIYGGDPAFGSSVALLWRPSDGTFRVLTVLGLSNPWPGVTMSAGVLHHIHFLVAEKKQTPGPTTNLDLTLYLDGVYYSGAATSPSGLAGASNGSVNIPTGLSLVSTPIAGYTTETIYAYAGHMSHLSLHTYPDVTYNSGTLLIAFPGGTSYYVNGTTAVQETAASRFARLGSWLNNTAISVSNQGVDQGDLLTVQPTAGQTALQAICDALRGEDALLDCLTVGGVETIRAWLASNQRASVSTFTIDVEHDAIGVPNLAFDTSGVAVAVAASSVNYTAAYTDRKAPVRWKGTTAALTGAHQSPAALLLMAQRRSLQGRTDRLNPATVVVDAVLSENNITTNLLTLRPGQRITLAGLPVALLGFTNLDAYFLGVAEQHTINSSIFAISLTPVESYLEATVESGVSQGAYYVAADYDVATAPTFYGATVDNLTSATVTATTYIRWSTNNIPPDIPFNVSAADFPLTWQVDQEQIIVQAPTTVTNTSGSWTALCNWTRGANGTTVVAHNGTNGTTNATHVPALIGGDAVAAY